MRTMNRIVSRRAEAEVRNLLRQFPAVAILGPRQTGKTTLATRLLQSEPRSVRLDLELPSDLARLSDPESYLRSHASDLVCIDEIQRVPDLFPVLRALIDKERRPGRFLVLGSASADLLRQSSETLAGRIAHTYLTPFQAQEVEGEIDRHDHWLRGGFPLSLLAESDEASYRWREQFVTTYLERDLPSLGIDLTRSAIGRLWTMIASGSGSLLNRAKFADPIGVSANTIQRYLDILESTFMIRVLRPAYANTKKRLIASPKVYIRDSGLLHVLSMLGTWDALYGSHLVGPSWESYAIEQIVSALPGWRAGFYRTADGAEIDLVLEGTKTIAIEMKAAVAPRVSRGFHLASDDVHADEKYIVAPLPTPDPYPIGNNTIVTTPELLVRELQA